MVHFIYLSFSTHMHSKIIIFLFVVRERERERRSVLILGRGGHFFMCIEIKNKGMLFASQLVKKKRAKERERE